MKERKRPPSPERERVEARYDERAIYQNAKKEIEDTICISLTPIEAAGLRKIIADGRAQFESEQKDHSLGDRAGLKKEMAARFLYNYYSVTFEEVKRLFGYPEKEIAVAILNDDQETADRLKREYQEKVRIHFKRRQKEMHQP